MEIGHPNDYECSGAEGQTFGNAYTVFCDILSTIFRQVMKRINKLKFVRLFKLMWDEGNGLDCASMHPIK